MTRIPVYAYHFFREVFTSQLRQEIVVNGVNLFQRIVLSVAQFAMKAVKVANYFSPEPIPFFKFLFYDRFLGLLNIVVYFSNRFIRTDKMFMMPFTG